MLSGSRQRHRHCAFVRLPQPRGCGLPIGAFNPGGLVVAPTHDHGQGIRLGRHEEAQPHRRREEALLRSPALLRRLFREAARLRRLVDVVFLVGVCAQLRLRAGWNQKAGQIPVRRSHPAGQPLVGEGVTSPGTDQVQVQGVDQALAHPRGIGDAARSPLSCHVGSIRFHAAAPAETVPHPVDVPNVDAVVKQALEDAQRFQIQTHALGARGEPARRQLHLVLLHLPAQCVQNALVPPPPLELFEFQRNDHARQRAHHPLHPRIVFLKLPDADLRSRLHAALDAVVVQGILVIRVPLRRIFRGRSQREQKRPGTHPLLRILQVVGDPGVRAPAPMIPAHRASGDAVKGLALNVLVQHELPRNGKRTLPVGEHGRPIAAAENHPQRAPVRSIAQAVPQQAIQIAPGPIQVHGGVQDLGCIREIGDLRLVGLIRPQEDLHPQPLV